MDGPLLEPRGVLSVARVEQETYFETVLAEGRAVNPDIHEIDVDEAVDLFPVLRGDRLARAMFEPGASDIDVSGLHQSFVRGATAAGATITPQRRATRIERTGDGWSIEAGGETLPADLVVNAAGAWGDHVAQQADLDPIGLQPLRRTAFMIKRPRRPVGPGPAHGRDRAPRLVHEARRCPDPVLPRR